MTSPRREYLHALRYDWLTPLYDPILRWTMRERTFKRQLVKQANIKEGFRVLDLACGTATLTLLAKSAHLHADVVGVDGDPKILAIARNKVAKANLDIALDEGMSFELPYPDESFDRVLCSLFFHHLTRESKAQTLAQTFRILRPGGELHVADWGKAQNPFMRLAFFQIQLLDGFKTTTDNVNGLLPNFFSEAGFQGNEEVTRYTTIFGTLSLYRARKTTSTK